MFFLCLPALLDSWALDFSRGLGTVLGCLFPGDENEGEEKEM